jgi:DNA repair photolyase
MIISASRRTDIPAYYSTWFFNRIEEGYVLVRNPINASQISKIDLSPDYVDCIVFWTKNPIPMLCNLKKLSAYMFYYQFTITSYDNDVEENIPSKNGIIDAFKKLSDTIGRNRVIWRYDPIFLSEKYTFDYHTENFERIAHNLKDFTEKCTISFIDDYAKIRGNMEQLNRVSMTVKDKTEIARMLSATAGRLGINIDTCAENIDLKELGINHAKCIDDLLIEKLVGCSLRVEKDKNQRLECGCIESIDIGQYNTCKNGCKYCYATYSLQSVNKNVLNYDPFSPLLCGTVLETDKVTERPVKSFKQNQLSFF